MSNLLIFLLGSWGFTHLLVSGKIFDKPRDWIIIKSKTLGGLISCYQCTGFWVGFLSHSLSLIANTDLQITYILLHSLWYGFIASGVSVIMNSIYVYINVLIIKGQKDSNKIS